MGRYCRKKKPWYFDFQLATALCIYWCFFWPVMLSVLCEITSDTTMLGTFSLFWQHILCCCWVRKSYVKKKMKNTRYALHMQKTQMIVSTNLNCHWSTAKVSWHSLGRVLNCRCNWAVFTVVYPNFVPFFNFKWIFSF